MLTVLTSGIDTLEATFHGTLAFPGELEHYRTLAQERDCPVPISIAGSVLYVQPRGLKPWRYLLTCDDFHLRLSDAKRIPTASVRLLSTAICHTGAKNLYEKAAEAAAECGARGEAGLSRIDTFADFQGFTPTDELIRDGIVTRLRYEGRHGHDKTTETYQAGKDSLVVRLYNKTREIPTSGKLELLDVWRENERYDPELNTWRFESQMRRSILKELGCATVEAALDRLGGLLCFSLDAWDLRLPSAQSSERWPRHPAWTALADAVPSSEPLLRVRKPRLPADLRYLIPQIGGCLSSFGAALGTVDLKETADSAQMLVAAYYEDRGRDFEQEVVTKALRRNT